jgi:hypothetical protein
MPDPVDVLDLSFLSMKSLFCVDNRRLLRVAYYAGLVCGLQIARLYTKINVTNADPRFWTLLSGISFPRPDVLDFVFSLKNYTCPEFIFDVRWIPEPGLRYGEPGVYYYSGIKNAVLVGIHQVPRFFRDYEDRNWRDFTLLWIKRQIVLAEASLDLEKRMWGDGHNEP